MSRNNFLKYIMIFILFILSIINVKAGLDGCGTQTIGVAEISAGMYAGFETTEYTCEWYDTGNLEVIGGEEMTFSAAQDIGLEEIEGFYTSADGKGVESSTYPRCEDPKSTVQATTPYNFQYDGAWYQPPGSCFGAAAASKGECEENGGSWTQPDGYYVCDQGGEGGGGSIECFIYDERIQSDEMPAINESTAAASAFQERTQIRKRAIERKDGLRNGKILSHGANRFNFKCPVYECNKTTLTFGACTPRFAALGSADVYCVNPTDGFHGVYGVEEFDVTSCKNSYSTLECGYANILIEGRYQKVDYNVINMALRLWGMYTNRGGFDPDKVGLSWLVAPQGGGACERGEHKDTLFVEKLYNVYRETYYAYFQQALDRVVAGEDYIQVGQRFTNIQGCGGLGVACMGVGTDYTLNAALALVFNTIKGNPYMLQHLEELFGTFSPRPTGVSYEGSEDGSTTVTVHYGEKITSVNKNIEIDCNKWKANPNAYAGGAEGFAEVKGYCKDSIVVKDSTGRETSYIPDTCRKGVGCKYKKVSMAMCDASSTQQPVTTTTTTTVTVKHVVTQANGAVKKLESCVSPEDQTMYLLMNSSGSGNGNPGGHDETSTTSSKTEDIVFQGPNYTCGNSCEDYSLRTQDSSCKYEQGKEINTESELAKGYIKDPSLKCLANMPQKEKYKYDYSEEFGVNKNFCRIYCSDEVEFMMSNRVTINSGEDIKIDIGVQAGFKYQHGKMISNVVRERRSCVSEIYYGGSSATNSGINFPEEPDWYTMYGITFSENEPHNIRNLYNHLQAKSASEGGRTENLNQVLYDLYNCNLYTEGSIPSIVTKPRENTIGNVYNYIMDTFYPRSQGYGLGLYFDVNGDNGQGSYLSSCASGGLIDAENNTCIKMNTISYTGGAEKIGTDSSVQEDRIERVGGLRDGDIKINFGSITKQDRSGISYCTGANCLKYDNMDKDSEYDYTMNKDGVGTTETLSFGNQSVTVPTNTYALFTVTTDVGFYIKNKFQTEPSSGYVTESKGKDSSSNYLDLPEFSLPVSSDAYTLCEEDNDSIRGAFKNADTSTRSCKMNYEYGVIATYFRKNTTDPFSLALKDTSSSLKKPWCYYNVQTAPPVTDKCKYAACDKENQTEEEKAKCKELCGTEDIVEYKNVNKSDIFPYKPKDEAPKGEDAEKTNWDTDWAHHVQDYLETTNVQTTRYSEDILDYSITLTPEQIKALRSYNKGKNYKNADVLAQTCTLAGEEGYEKFYNCKSKFMENLRLGEKEFGDDKYGSLDVDYNGVRYKIDSGSRKINGEKIDPNWRIVR